MSEFLYPVSADPTVPAGTWTVVGASLWGAVNEPVTPSDADYVFEDTPAPGQRTITYNLGNPVATAGLVLKVKVSFRIKTNPAGAGAESLKPFIIVGSTFKGTSRLSTGSWVTWTEEFLAVLPGYWDYPTDMVAMKAGLESGKFSLETPLISWFNVEVIPVAVSAAVEPVVVTDKDLVKVVADDDLSVVITDKDLSVVITDKDLSVAVLEEVV